MSEVVLRIEGKELVLDDSAVTGLNIKIDHEKVPCAEYGCGGCGWVHRRVLPTSHLTLDFGDGKHPHEEADPKAPGGGTDSFGCAACHWGGTDYGASGQGWCTTVKLLAAPYSGRPGFDAAWKLPDE